MKLIEAKQAKEFASTFLADKILQAAVNAVLDNAPGVELVRCKDCVNYYGFEHCRNGICDEDLVRKRAVYPDDFCSRGERRTDG